MMIAFLLGFGIAVLAYGPRLAAQPQNIVTLYGCGTVTNAQCVNNQPIKVDSSGNVQIIGR